MINIDAAGYLVTGAVAVCLAHRREMRASEPK
jgi:hypothetical protein